MTDPKASFIIRGGASMIDSLVLFIPTTIASVIPVLGPLAAQWAYFILLTNNWEGATLGKRFFGIKVAAAENKPATLGSIVLRETIAKILSGIVLGLGYLWVIWDKDKQSWHDKMAKTYVYQVKPVTTIKKVLAWILVLIFPTIAALAILAATILLIINPKALMDQAKQQQQQYYNSQTEYQYPDGYDSSRILDETESPLQTQ